MAEANEVQAKIERVTPGSDVWCVPCPFDCGWAEKDTKPSVLIEKLIKHLNARHEIASA